MQSWKVGDVKITKIVELVTTNRFTWILPDATPEALLEVGWLVPHFANAEGKGILSVHAFVVESGGQRIVVDTCIGNHKERPAIPRWHRLDGSFLRDLEAAGFAPDSIDKVLCTHLHVDHVGWNTRLDNGRWVPTFRNARYLFNREEFEYWKAENDLSLGDIMGDSVGPVFEAGLADLVGPEHSIDDAVRLEPSPGHTPGHVSVHIASHGEEAVITGDLMHHPAQCAHPDWASIADVDAARAEETRRAFLKRYAGADVLVLGTHFNTPTAGRIVGHGRTYRFAV
jgi:glyoxylase-like metal-dependent hydrolase (beta-lactamase superfamily II)